MHLFHAWFRVPQNTLVVGRLFLYWPVSRDAQSNYGELGGKRLGPAKSKGPWPSRLLMDGKLLAMSVCDVESKPCRDAA